MSPQNTYLLIGLGNPGSEYEQTRHNIGFMIVDYLADMYGGVCDSKKWSAMFCKVRYRGVNVICIKPMTYMNKSGESVRRFVDFYKCSMENVIVFHDDIDMKPGRLKITSGGGAGGHNGIKSIIQHCSSREFFRLKFGVGRPGKFNIHPDIPVDRFVLSRFNPEEKELTIKRMTDIADGIDRLLEGDGAGAMRIVNSIK